MYNAWNNLDLCSDVACKANEHCVIRSKGTAVCVKKQKKDQAKKQQNIKNKESKRNKLTRDDKLSAGKRMKYGEQATSETMAVLRHDEKEKMAVRLQSSCKTCPVVRPDFVCGFDNSTYSTRCRLDFHNCVHDTKIEVACKGFCPCKAQDRKSKRTEKWDKSGHKYQRTQRQEKTKSSKLDSNATPKTRFHDDLQNSIEPLFDKQSHISKSRPHAVAKPHVCSKEELHIMGDRLLDWFSVILTDQKRKRKEKRRQKQMFKITDCKVEIGWMFHHMDIDGDMKLSLKELYDLEHDKREPCLKQYLYTCDEDKDTFLNPYEWCTCFEKKSTLTSN